MIWTSQCNQCGLDQPGEVTIQDGWTPSYFPDPCVRCGSDDVAWSCPRRHSIPTPASVAPKPNPASGAEAG